MANPFEVKDRRVIPNWRSFKKTAMMGELNPISKDVSKINLHLSIDDYIDSWQKHQNAAHAGDLISAGIVNGLANNQMVIDAADFILRDKKSTTSLQVLVAKKIINQLNPQKFQTRLDQITVEDFENFVSTDVIKNKIHHLRKSIVDFPFNPISHVELSRNHSILGNKKKAINHMKIALQLAPQNRFILRCAVRLFSHYEEREIAHDLVRKCALTEYDPWLMSAEIALATLRGRTSRFMKRGSEIVNSKSYLPFSITELASSIATVELLNGRNKKSRSLFNIALKDPNDNTLAQIEWASSKDAQLNVNLRMYDVPLDFEAVALKSFYNNQFHKALDNATRWFLDMPFSKRPIMFGAHIAGTLLDNQDIAREFLTAGMISHPNDPQLLNNLIYSYALENKTSDAMKYLRELEKSTKMEKTTEICLKATRGLVYFRSNLINEGRKLYLEAIEETQHLPSQISEYFNWLAILNYAREELLVKSEYIRPIMDVVTRIPNESRFYDINKLKTNVIALYDKVKEVAIQKLTK